jgi:hypothetical protein
MGLIEETQKTFKTCMESAEERREQNKIKKDEDNEKVAAKFKMVADTIRAIEEVAKVEYPKINFWITDHFAEISGNGNKLSISGNYKFNIYLDFDEHTYFNLYLEDDEIDAVRYLTVKVISDYISYGTIPKDTVYYKLNELGQTEGSNRFKVERLQKEILQIITEEERLLFSRNLSYFYFEDEDEN